MYDFFAIKIPFNVNAEVNGRSLGAEFKDGELSVVDLSLLQLAIPSLRLVGSVSCDTGGNQHVDELKHPYDNLPSYYSGLAFKIFEHGQNNPAHIEIKGSPAKLLQGHNVYGSTDARTCIYSMLVSLLHAYPYLNKYLHLKYAEISFFDTTFSARLANEHELKQVLIYLESVSGGQAKVSRAFTASSVYWGKSKSRLICRKAYGKLQELIERQIPELERKYKIALRSFELSSAAYSTSKARDVSRRYFDAVNKLEGAKRCLDNTLAQREFCTGLLRLEARIKKEYMKRHEIPNNVIKFIKYCEKYQADNGHSFAAHAWRMAFNPILKTLEGNKMNINKDDEIRESLLAHFTTYNKNGKPNINNALAAFRTFRNLKLDGWEETKETMSSTTFYRHISMLKNSGCSQADLQNVKNETNIVPVVRLLNIDFSNQRPAHYSEPVLEDFAALLDVA